MMGTPQEIGPRSASAQHPQNAVQHRSTALPRTPAAVISSFRLGNQPIKNFALIVTQISRSITHMFVDATTGACG
jgi:hypothetical protein